MDGPARGSCQIIFARAASPVCQCLPWPACVTSHPAGTFPPLLTASAPVFSAGTPAPCQQLLERYHAAYGFGLVSQHKVLTWTGKLQAQDVLKGAPDGWLPVTGAWAAGSGQAGQAWQVLPGRPGPGSRRHLAHACHRWAVTDKPRRGGLAGNKQAALVLHPPALPRSCRRARAGLRRAGRPDWVAPPGGSRPAQGAGRVPAAGPGPRLQPAAHRAVRQRRRPLAVCM